MNIDTTPDPDCARCGGEGRQNPFFNNGIAICPCTGIYPKPLGHDELCDCAGCDAWRDNQDDGNSWGMDGR